MKKRSSGADAPGKERAYRGAASGHPPLQCLRGLLPSAPLWVAIGQRLYVSSFESCKPAPRG